MPGKSSRPETNRTVRVFISSTFRDMHAERDHLVTVVFPELRERLEQLGLEFYDVDLRWGVPETGIDGEKANSWEYCKRWIDRVEPFFVCMLGERYGWVPTSHEIKDDEDRKLWAGLSVTDMEVRHAVLSQRVQRRSSFYIRETFVPEPPLTESAVYKEFVDSEPASVSNLEKLKTELENSSHPVRRYICRWTGSFFENLDAFGRMVLEDLWSGVLRDERYVSKEIWLQALGVDPETDPRYIAESQPVPPDLAAEIVSLAKPTPNDWLHAEREQMEAFAQTRLRWFQGRSHELRQLTEFIQSTDDSTPRLAVVAAAPGQGKSALLAKLNKRLIEEKDKEHKPPLVVVHFVGATERSSTAYALVERLLGELNRSDIDWLADEQIEGEEPNRDLTSLSNRLKQGLENYAGERKIVILLDALNQLTDGHGLGWLPRRPGPSVRMIVSCVDDPDAVSDSTEQRVLQALDSMRSAQLRLPLGQLTEADVRAIVIEYLKEYCKELDREHLDAICHMEQTKNPLYLLVMLGEFRTIGGNDMNRIVGELIAALPRDLPNTIALFRWVLKRLEVFGTESVRWWCLYLLYGRAGMASDELADLLAIKFGVEARTRALRVERGLRRYLLRRGRQFDFFHGQLRQAVIEHCGAHAQTGIVHGEIADYFVSCARGTDPQKEWETDSMRGFSECVFHLTRAGRYDQATEFQSNFPFLLNKLRLGLLEGVCEDYEVVLLEAPTDIVKRLGAWSTFFREKAYILRRGDDRWPAHKILLQLAVEQSDDSPMTVAAEKWLEEGKCDWIWLRRLRRLAHMQNNPCLCVFEGHTDSVNGALSLPDGRVLSWSMDSTLRLWDGKNGRCLFVLEGHTEDVKGACSLPGGRLLSWSNGKTLRLWDGKSGGCLFELGGHTDSVKGALPLPDGRVLSWSMDKTLRLWDVKSGKCLCVLKGHTGWVDGALSLPDGRLLSWSDDKTLRLWDVQSGKCLHVLEGHTDGNIRVLSRPDGCLVSWSGKWETQDKTLRLWDVQNGERLHVYEGHTHGIDGALCLPDSSLLSWSQDATLRLWGAQGGENIRLLKGHTEYVNGAYLLSDGRVLSWSWDTTLRLWDVQSGECLCVLRGHDEIVKGALSLPDGNLVSWSLDGTLRVWDGWSGKCIHVLKGHTEMVIAVLLLPDGCLLSRSGDKTLRLWDSQSGECLSKLEGHTSLVKGAFSLPDGSLISWSSGDTLRLWDSQSRSSTYTHDGHSDQINGTIPLPDERLLTWSDDKTLRLWDCQGRCLCVLEGHMGEIRGALSLPDSRLLSWGGTNLRLWDTQSGGCLNILEGHTIGVKGALSLPDGRVLSWSWDKTLRLWDVKSGKCLCVLKGHTDWVDGALSLSDGCLLSWSTDGTLRLWDGQSGEHLHAFERHSGRVEGALSLPDGHLLSWSADGTLRVWDGWNRKCLHVLKGHSEMVWGVLCLSGDRLLSGAYDNTLRLWDAQSGECLHVLEGHMRETRGALSLGAISMPDGRFLSWSLGGTIRLWDDHSGECLASVSEEELPVRHPEWLYAKSKKKAAIAFGGFCKYGKGKSLSLCHKNHSGELAYWHGESVIRDSTFLGGGALAVGQSNGQVCFLKFQHGHREASLVEVSELLEPPRV